MKLQLKKLGQVSESTTESKKMRLSADASAMVFQIFTKNVYSNPIGTIVREITSNCFDSHVEANVNLPVEIKLTYDSITKTHYVSFIDYGVGMSPDRIDNVYSVYFESTKRDNNNQIGGFGIGGKTPLAYKRFIGTSDNDYDNSFYIITNYNGIKYTYTIYEGPDSPVVSLLDTQDTTDGNGTEIRVPVLEKDIYKFATEIKRQLYYFENLIISGFNEYYYNFNDYTIVRTNTFLFRGNEYSDYIHVCLGRVAYPIDYTALGISSSRYKYPIAIKLNVGDLNVTVSREAIDYSEKTISFLKKKLNEVTNEINELINKQYDSVITLEDYLKTAANFGTLYLTEKHYFNISSNLRYSDCEFKNFKYNEIKSKINNDTFSQLYYLSRIGAKISRTKHNDGKLSYEQITSTKIYYIEETDSYIKNIIKNKYIKKHHSFNYMINFIPEENINNVSDIEFELFNEFRELIKKYGTNYNEFTVPQSYLDFLKQERIEKRELVNRLKNEINAIVYYGGDSYNISKNVTNFNELIKLNGTIFYGTKDYTNELINASHFFETFFNSKYIIHSLNPVSFEPNYKSYHRVTLNEHKENILFIQVPKSQLKHFIYCKNAYHVKDFYSKMGRRKENQLVSIQENIETKYKYNEIPSFLQKNEYSVINSTIANKIKIINEYFEKNKNYLDTWALNKFINAYNIKSSKSEENKEKLRLIDEVNSYYNKNKNVFSFINFPFQYHLNNEFIKFMKKNLK